MKKNELIFQHKKSKGMTLIISLIFLLIISLIGMSVLNVSTVEEKMAGGTRDKDLAFQSAEIALRRAEEYISDSVVGSTGFTTACTLGLCAELPISSTVMRWEDENYCGTDLNIWSCDKSTEVNASLISTNSFSKNPRYFIEILGIRDYGTSVDMSNMGDESHDDKVQIYRITAIGYGGSNSSKVLLQSTYGKKI